MARDPDDLESGRPQAGLADASAEPARSASPQKADIERTLRQGADGFRFGRLIDGVRPDSDGPSAPMPWTDALVDDPSRRPSSAAPPQERGGRVPAIWIGVAAILFVLVVMQAAVLLLMAARSPGPPTSALPQTPIMPRAPLPAGGQTAPDLNPKQARPTAGTPAARVTGVPQPHPAAARSAESPVVGRPARAARRWRRTWVRRRTHPVRRILRTTRRSGPRVVGHAGNSRRANDIIDRLPQ